MKSANYIPLHLLVGQIIGIMIGFSISLKIEFLISFIILIISILSVIFIISRRKLIKDTYFAIFTFLLFITVGILSSYITTNKNHKTHYTSFLSESNAAILVIDNVLKNNNYYYNYNASVTTINTKKCTGKIRLSVFKDSLSKSFDVGNIVYLNTVLDSVSSPKNPYEFNFKEYLAKQQIYHQITVKSDEVFLLETNKTSLKHLAYKLRNTIKNKLVFHGLKGDELSVTEALLLGQRQHISEEIIENYQNAGAVHILALSGLHIGIILLMLNFMLKPLLKLPHGKIIRLIITVVLLWAYAILAGLSPSIVRAVTMFTAVAFALVNDESLKSTGTYRILIVSAFVLLLINPYYLTDVGFQLSYLAVFFIVWLQPLFNKLWKPRYKIIRYFWNILTVSFAAQIGVLPLSIYYFHQFPGLFFITNLLILPTLGIILGLGFISIILAFFDLLPTFLVHLYEMIIKLMNSVVDWVAHQEVFLFQNLQLSSLALFVCYVAIIFFFLWISNKKSFYLNVAMLMFISFQMILIHKKYTHQTYDEFVIFNTSKNSVLGSKRGLSFTINYASDSINLQNKNFIKTYLTNTKSIYKTSQKNNHNIYYFNDKNLLIVDSLGVYQLKDFKPTYVLLTNSPTINLERLINTLHPELIIADASNYKSYVRLWQKTCKNHNIKFHYTVTNGAFVERFYK